MNLFLKILRFKLKIQSWLSETWAARSALKLFCTPFNKKIRKREVVFYQNKGKFARFESEKGLASYHFGKEGPIVWVIHGWEGNLANFAAIIEKILSKGFQVYGIDAPAHGYSSGKRTSLPEYADALSKFSRFFPEPEIVITHSFGGPAFFYHLYKQNRSFKGKLIILTIPDQLNVAFNDFYKLLKISDSVQKEIEQLVHKRFQIYPKDIVSSKIASGLTLGQVHIFHDINDKVLPIQNSEKVAKAIPQSKFYQVSGKGHYRILWDPEIIHSIQNILIQ